MRDGPAFPFRFGQVAALAQDRSEKFAGGQGGVRVIDGGLSLYAQGVAGFGLGFIKVAAFGEYERPVVKQGRDGGMRWVEAASLLKAEIRELFRFGKGPTVE
jgi:hypothetical protein